MSATADRLTAPEAMPEMAFQLELGVPGEDDQGFLRSRVHVSQGAAFTYELFPLALSSRQPSELWAEVQLEPDKPALLDIVVAEPLMAVRAAKALAISSGFRPHHGHYEHVTIGHVTSVLTFETDARDTATQQEIALRKFIPDKQQVIVANTLRLDGGFALVFAAALQHTVEVSLRDGLRQERNIRNNTYTTQAVEDANRSRDIAARIRNSFFDAWSVPQLPKVGLQRIGEAEDRFGFAKSIRT